MVPQEAGLPADPGEWHTYQADVRPDLIRWKIDGVERMAMRNDGYLAKPVYFLISIEIGGNWAGSPDATTPWPMVTEVNYVRGWQL